MSELVKAEGCKGEDIIRRLNELPDSYRLAVTIILSEAKKNPDSLLPCRIDRLISQ
jgi:hypothetical protein